MLLEYSCRKSQMMGGSCRIFFDFSRRNLGDVNLSSQVIDLNLGSQALIRRSLLSSLSSPRGQERDSEWAAQFCELEQACCVQAAEVQRCEREVLPRSSSLSLLTLPTILVYQLLMARSRLARSSVFIISMV